MATRRPILKFGMQGPEVAVLQRALGMVNANGMGNFGPLTEAAVRSFQRKYRLKVDGIVGPETWETLDRRGP